ncbi:TolC family protein [Arcobacter sp. LA11]|uniref:TolC family protein n=1 Tax=Arcobacter sp. LA11 TaxID=1898176 RepID=UPI00093362F8|nr:TolC family protein [Arcobacter sp. LA11]
MHLQKSARFFLISLLSLPLFLEAEDKSILSEDRLNLFKYSEKQNEENSQKLKKDWINPINLTYSKNYGETYDSTKSMININQPIFKSGGIYKAIKYANASFEYNNIDIEIQKKELIKTATTLLFNLHIIDLNIQKNELLLKNANIDIIRKKEQVLNGFLDTSYLDNAILDANKVKNTIVELQYQKEEINNNFLNIASGDYKSFDLPTLELADEKTFIEKNIELTKTKADINQKDYLKDITVAKYLPTFNANLDYTKYHDTDNNPSITDTTVQNYGLSVTMPIDVRTFNDIETQKIEYLKAKLDLKNKILEEENFYKTKISKIKMLNQKKKIAKDDYELYNSLLEIIVEEKNAELKTQSDVDTLQNSQKIKSIELNIFKLEEQIELLEIYSKIS